MALFLITFGFFERFPLMIKFYRYSELLRIFNLQFLELLNELSFKNYGLNMNSDIEKFQASSELR